MNLVSNNDDRLDDLLSRPALLSNHGFTEMLQARLEKGRRVRLVVFWAVAAISMGLFLTMFPVEGLLLIGEQIGAYLIQFIQLSDFSDVASTAKVQTLPLTWASSVIVLISASVAISFALLD